MLGGEIDNNDEATFGTGTSTGIDSVRADVAFIGVGGFAEDGGMTDYSITAAETRGKMILCGRAYLLADQTKFTRRTPFRVPNMEQMRGRHRRPHAGPAARIAPGPAWAGRSSSQNRSW